MKLVADILCCKLLFDVDVIKQLFHLPHQELTALQRQLILVQKGCLPNFLFRGHFYEKYMFTFLILHKQNTQNHSNVIIGWFRINIILPKSRSCQESSWLSVIINIWYCANCIWDFIIHNGIHMNSYWIFGQYLLKR